MTTRQLFKLSICSFILAIAIMASGLSVLAAPKDIERIQWEGNRYHGVDYATTDAIRLGKPLPKIKEPWTVRKKGQPGSCTHAVAYKVRELAKAGYMALVSVYMHELGYNHTVVVVMKRNGSGYWIMDNNRDDVYSVDKPWGWIGTIEQARKIWP